MIENYKINQYGIIEQINKKPYNYDFNYSNNYNNPSYKDNSILLNGARLSFCHTNYLNYGNKKINSILDIGYGNGDFLKECSKIIKDCNGYDVSPYPLEEPIKTVSNMFNRYYDIITFWDSLEHFENLDFVQNLKCNMICISMPYCHWKNDKDDEWFKNWKHRKPDEHLYHFNPSSLNSYMESMGYKCLMINSNIEEIVRQNKNEPKQNIFSSCYIKLY
jgi:hypothetical protein